MKVGVVVPARNALKTIECLVDTCKAQTYPVSVYIADDCSDDGMTPFLQARPSWYTRMTTLPERSGWPGATNAAAQMAVWDGCDALMIAAADDFLRLDCVEKLLAALPGNDFAVPMGQQVGGVKQRSLEGLSVNDFVRYQEEHKGPWCPLIDKALIRTYVWENVGGYSTDITIPDRPWGCAEDWDFWIKVFKAGYTRYAFIEDPVYYNFVHDGQLGNGRELVHHLTIKALREKHHDLPWEDPE